MSTLKKIFWTIIALEFIAGILYLVQPTDPYLINGDLSSVVSSNQPTFRASICIRLPEEIHIKNPDRNNPHTACFEYPKANNWSYHNRKKLPFPPELQFLSVYFGDKLRTPTCRARIYLLENRWTKNFTRDEPVADISCPVKGEEIKVGIFLPIFRNPDGSVSSDIVTKQIQPK